MTIPWASLLSSLTKGPGLVAGIVLGAGLGLWGGDLMLVLAAISATYSYIMRMVSSPLLMLTVIGSFAKLGTDAELRTLMRRLVVVSLASMIVAAGVSALSAALISATAAPDFAALALMGKVVSANPEASVMGVELNSAQPASSGGSISFVTGLLRLIPDNIFKALVQSNTEQLCVFSILFGAAVFFSVSSSTKSYVDIIDGLSSVFFRYIELLQKVVPLIMCGLVAHLVATTDGSMLGVMKAFIISHLAVSLTIVLCCLMMVSLVSRRGLPEVISMYREAVLAALASKTAAVSLPYLTNIVADCCRCDRLLGESLISVSLALFRVGATVCLATYGTVIASAYGLPLTPLLLLLIVTGSMLASFLILGTGGSTMLTIGLTTLCGVAHLPVEAYLVLIITVYPLLEFLSLATTVIATGTLATLVLSRKPVQIAVTN